MAEFPYLSNTGNLKKFFTGITTIAVPNNKVTQIYLESLGYKSKGDREIIKVLSFLEFIDSDKKPTKLWREYRNTEKGPAILSNAIKSSYKILYETYPDAHNKDDEALRNLLASHSNLGKGALSYMIGTFKTLIKLADFEAGAKIENNAIVEKKTNGNDPSNDNLGNKRNKSIETSKELVMNINIQLQLPESSDSETFDKFFEALSKHLLKE